MASLRTLKTRILPALLLVFFSSVSAWATHIFGLDFYYSYVSGNTYRIHLVVYGDCSGSAFPTLPTSTPQVRVYNGGSLFTTMNLAVQPPSAGIEVTPVCPSQINNTTCVNPLGTIPGIKKFVYSANVTLPTTSSVWRFVFTGNMGVSSAGRSTSITNVIMGATGSIIQLTDTLNNTVYTNSSAYYTTIPTPFYCINRPASFNPGAVDVNGDSLHYTLVPGVDGNTGSNLTYVTPYTPTNPIGAAAGTFSFSSLTGQLAFTPNIVQKSLVVYNVREFRGGVMVGTSQREMTVVVIASCTNTPPGGGMSAASAGTIVSPTQMNICNNVGPFNFHIDPTDPDGDTVDMTVAGLPTGATFNIVNNGTPTPLGTFSWNTTGVTPGNYTFFITYQDRGCPITSSQTIAYTVTVLPVATATVSILSPATCVAKSAVQVVPAGPTAPYAINVMIGTSVLHSFPSVTSSVLDSLVPGSYTVTVSNSQCTSSYPITIAAPVTPAISAVVSQPLCPGSTGTVTVTGSGGVTPYSYSVNSGAYGASNVFPGLTTGTYVFHVKGANQCIKDTTISITQPTPIIPHAIVRSPMCSTVANGQVTLSAAGGTPAYTYALGSGVYGSSGIFTPLAAGTYLFHTKDANGCIKDTSITLADSLHIGALVSAPAILCNGGSSAVVVTGTGSPTSSYTYAYNSTPFGSTGTFSLTAGAYVLHVREASTCQFDTAIILTQPPAGVVNGTPTNITCGGSGSGSISVTASGGTPSYMYGIAGGPLGSSPLFSPLAAGTYVVRVQDANGCIYYDTAIITQPSTIVIDSVTITRPLCFGNANGSLHIYAHGGTPPLTYAMGTGAYGTSAIMSGLASGTYLIHVKDANGCVKDTTVTISQPTSTIPSAIVRRPMCSTVANGQVTLSATGGTPSYTYALGSGAYGSSGIFTPLAAGTYLFHIKDANGCIKDTTITLADSLHIGAIVSAPAILCNGGTSVVTITGTGSPTGSYTYAYNTNPFGSVGTFSLTAGIYVLHVREASTCQFDTSITLSHPPAGIVNATPTNINCSGAATGSISVTASGGTPSYMYGIAGGPLGSSSVFSPLAAGTYVVRVQDANGCIYYDTAIVTQPAPIVIDSVTITRPLCFGNANGSLHIYAHGGTSPFTFAIGAGAYGPSAVISGLAAGTYLVHVKDANGCVKDTTVSIAQPTKIIPNAIVRRPMCSTVANGQVALSAAGGTPSYTYAMGSGSYASSGIFTPLAAGTYLFHIKDANGCIKDTSITLIDSIHVGAVVSAPPILCNGGSSVVVVAGTGSPSGSYTYAHGSMPFGSSGTFTLTAGVYVLHVRDVSTCQFDTSITLSHPPAGIVNATPANVSCAGAATGSVSVSASGGTPSYMYSIGGGAFGPSPVFGSLTAGTYIIQVKDANGCIYYDTVVVTQPAPIVIDSIATIRPQCFGNANGSAHIYAHGGTPSLTYAIGPGAYGASAVMGGLAAGTYVLHVRDANGCIKDTTVTITQPSSITPHATVKSPICNTLANGKVTLSATGGTPTYTYALGSGSYGTASVFTPLAAGTYLFHIKDANGCVKDTTITLVDSLHIVATAAVTPALCYGDTSGTLLATGSGGTAPYSYAIGSGSFVVGSLFSGLGAGSYVVHVRDNNGCLKDTTALITQPLAVVPHISVTEPTCFGYSDGKVTVTATGGTPAYQYAYNYGPFSGPGVFSTLAAGVAHVQVKDANGCIRDTTFTIHEPLPLTVSVTPANLYCHGDNDGSITVVGSGGVMPYKYAINTSGWTPGGTFTDLGAGVYTIHVKDSNDCPIDTVGELQEPEPISALVDIVNPTCEGFKDGAVTIHASGGSAPYTYKGTGTFQADSVFYTLGEGGYTFNIKDAHGCLKNITTNLQGYPHIKAEAITKAISCPNDTDGMIKVIASGGTSPFTYQLNSGVAGPVNTFTHLGVGAYAVTVIDSHQCRKEISATIGQPEPLAVTFTVTDNKCEGYDDQGAVLATVTGGVPPYTYTWNYKPEWNTAQIGPLPNGVYGVVIKDSNNCTIWEKAEVKYSSCCHPFIPNAFTPNADGKNDIFRIGHNGDMIILDFKIYNRFGEEVYNSNDPNGGWDGYYKGVRAELGTYYYYARIICGNDKKDKVIFMKGDVTLIQ